MLLQNISKSPYFQKCVEKLTDWNMCVDEIYYEVKHMEPWTAGEFCQRSVGRLLFLMCWCFVCWIVQSNSSSVMHLFFVAGKLKS